MWRRFKATLEDQGLRGIVLGGRSFIRWAFRGGQNDAFDNDLHVDTAGQVPAWRLGARSPNAKFAVHYGTVAPSVFLWALGSVDLSFRDLCFVDLGCGKGRMLILAAQRRFKRVVGVEFAPSLAAVARENLKRCGLEAEVVEGDAAQYQFPDEDLLVYLYNPFGSPVMAGVVKNLLDWRKTSSRMAYVFYLTDVHRKLFESEPAFELMARQESLSVWRLL